MLQSDKVNCPEKFSIVSQLILGFGFQILHKKLPIYTAVTVKKNISTSWKLYSFTCAILRNKQTFLESVLRKCKILEEMERGNKNITSAVQNTFFVSMLFEVHIFRIWFSTFLHVF